MVLPNRQIARSFFGFAATGPSGQSAGFVSRFTQSLAGAVLLVLLTLFAVVANAVDQTWDNGAATGNWNTTDANFTGVVWTNGNTAVFGGPASSTVTLTAPISATGVTFNVTGDILTGNTLTLTGTPAISTGGNAATINSILDGAVGVVVEGGGTVNFGGVNTIRARQQVATIVD